MNNYVTAILHIMPSARLTILDENSGYEGIQWDDDRSQPTKAECDAVIAQALYEREYASVKGQRQSRYEAETDGIFFDSMRADGDLTEWKAAVEAIKTELPYPTEPS